MKTDLDGGFAARVLDRIDAVETDRDRRAPWAYAAPLVAIAVVVGCWLVSLVVGVAVVRGAIAALAWLSAVGQLEQHLSTALLGPFAPLPLVVSLLLFVAALGWVRSHQPDPEGRR